MRARRRKIARGDAVRAEIVLLAAEGMNNCAIAATLGLSRLTAGLWRKRFVKKRFDGLDDEPRCGAPRTIGDEKIAEVVTKTLETMPAAHALEHPLDGENVRRIQLDSASHLECFVRPASQRDFQALERSAVR